MDMAEPLCTPLKLRMPNILITEQFNLHIFMRGGLLMVPPLLRLEPLLCKKKASFYLRSLKEAQVQIVILDLILKLGSYFEKYKSFGK